MGLTSMVNLTSYLKLELPVIEEYMFIFLLELLKFCESDPNKLLVYLFSSVKFLLFFMFLFAMRIN